MERMKKDIKKFIYTFVLIAVAVLSSVFIFVPEGVASANSAWNSYDGVDSVGAIVKGGNCPIVVDREDLTFDIYQSDVGIFYDEYESPTGKVSAKYTFRNPTDITAKVGLIFPFGYAPEHYEYATDKDKDNKKYYSVNADGADIPKRIRNTYKQRRENYDIVQFDLDTDVEYLSEDYIENDELKKDTKVYKYVCHAKDGYDIPQKVSVWWIDDGEGKVFCNYSNYDEYGYYAYERVYVKCDENGDAVFYSTQDISSSLMIKDAGYKDRVLDYEVAGEDTLFNAVMSTYDEGNGVEEADWYNSFVARYYKCKTFINTDFKVEDRFRWYDYTLEFAPYQTIVNEVVAPLYPHVTRKYTPRLHNYTYLLSPAKSWASFGEFHLRINTDMYVKNASVGKLKKHKGYYEYSCQGLPDGELTFSMCKSPAPITRSAWWGLVITGIALAITSVIWIPIIAVVIVKVRKKRIEKKVLQSYSEQKPPYSPVSQNEYYNTAYDGKSDIDNQTRKGKKRK